jgi:glycosyltransferase involved in cell wall biosynthesis
MLTNAFGVAFRLPHRTFLRISSGWVTTGLPFDPTSVASIKDAILRIVRDPGLARRLGERGRERMRAMTPERYGAQLEALLHDLQLPAAG